MRQQIEYDVLSVGEFRTSKLFGFYIPDAIQVNKKYFFNNSPELDGKQIVGIDAYCFDALNPNYPQTVLIQGQVYNTIAVGDAYKVLCFFCNDAGETLLKNPLSAFSRFATVNNTASLELREYDLKIRSGKSYFVFVEAPLVTPNPVYIPFNFFFK